MKVYFINYADDRYNHRGGKFRANQIALNQSALEHGIKDIVSWTWDDMTTREFYRQNKDFLDRDRYQNGNVFKPYIILELLEKINPGDIVFYYDCSKVPIRKSVEPLIALCKKNNGTLFHRYYSDLNRNWTKRDAFVYMGCDTPKYHDAVALQNTWFLMEKNEFALKFTQEWLKFNLDERIASYVKPDTCGLPALTGFIENRGDQSIFSVLAEKYGIKSYYGMGGGKNRDVNNFIEALQENPVKKIYRFAKRFWTGAGRKKILANWSLEAAAKRQTEAMSVKN